jgi:hypothetical protein
MHSHQRATHLVVRSLACPPVTAFNNQRAAGA